MTTIAFIGNKGGAGKTTLAINFAITLNENADTYLLDADPQGSTLHWSAMVESDFIPTVIDATESVADTISQHQELADYLIIDCPPQLHSKQTRDALQHCDMVVIPVLPSPLDLWATVAVSDAIAEAQKVNKNLKALLVINQLEPRTKLSKMVTDAIQELGLPAAATTLHRRVVYRSSMLEGKSVGQVGKKGEIAADEINRLMDEVLTA